MSISKVYCNEFGDDGKAKEGQGRGLIGKLDTAIKQVDKGKLTLATQ